jgi:hypothetical protein
MQCATGFGNVGEYLPMSAIKEMACKSFYDFVGRKESAQFINYQREVCRLAIKHIGNTFSDLEHEFCMTASPEIRATAELMHKTFGRTFVVIGIFGAAAAVALKMGSVYAKKQGYTTTANVMKAGMCIAGMLSFRYFYAAYSIKNP